MRTLPLTLTAVRSGRLLADGVEALADVDAVGRLVDLRLVHTSFHYVGRTRHVVTNHVSIMGRTDEIACGLRAAARAEIMN